MNSVSWYLVAACFAGIQAAPSLSPLPVNPGGIGGLFRGPNSETIIKGPDGSQIISEQLGGAVETETKLEPIVVPEILGDQIAVPSISAVPVEAVNVAREISYANPSEPSIEIQKSVHPVVLASTPQQLPVVSPTNEPHIIETVLVDAPDIEPDQNSDLKGPSGSISVRGSSSIVSGPASTTISEPVRQVPIATIPVQPAIFQPQYTDFAGISQSQAVGAIKPVEAVPQPFLSSPLRTDLVASVPAETPLLPLRGIQDTGLRTELVSPSVPLSLGITPTLNDDNLASANPRSEISLISLAGSSGQGTPDATLRTDLTPPDITIISSTQAPPVHLSTEKSIDLGETVMSSTVTPVSVSLADIDASRINLEQTNAQAVGKSEIASNWAVPPSSGQNIIYSNAVPELSPSRQIPTSVGRPSRPLFITAAELQRITHMGSNSDLANSNIILQSNAVNDGVTLQDQAVLTNQLVSSTPRYFDIDRSDSISQQRQVASSLTNIQSRPWLNVQPTLNLPSNVSPSSTSKNHETPIASILDSVFVQPTDPRNREIIEFGGKQLENVGNIVPVIQHPILLTGNLNNIQKIPTASISQLSSRNELDPSISNRYGRYALETN